MPSLVTVMGQELARLLEPLVSAASAPERWPLVLDLIGHTPDTLGNTGLRNALDELGALAKLDGADLETWDGIAALLSASSHAMQALHDLEHAVDDPALAGRLEGLGPELAQQLVAVYLRTYHSRTFRTAAGFGIIDPAEAHAPQPAQFDASGACMRAAWSDDQIHLDRIGPLLRDPFTLLRATFLPNDLRAAADAHAAADVFFPLLRAALGEFGIGTRDDRVSLLPDDPAAASGDGGHFDDPQPDPDAPAPPPVDITPYFRNTLPRLTIRIPQLQADGSLAGTFLGIDVAVSSLEHPGAFAGLIVGLTGALNWTQTQGAWTVALQTSGDVPAFGIGPQGMALAPGAAALAGATGKFSVARVADAAPAFVFGSPTGTRLELGKVQFGIGFAVAPSHVSGNLGVSVDKAALVIGGGDGDGFLSSVLPSNGLRADFDLGLTLDSDQGFALHGGAGLLVNLPTGLSLGGLTLPTLHVGIRIQDGQLATELSADVSLSIGPVQAALDRIGMLATLSFPDGGGNLGVADLALGFQPPAGAGIAVDAAGVLTGGGFLFKDPAQSLYAGVLQLTVHERITLTAFGLIATRMPDGSRGYSMIVFITAEGFQPIQLGMGFTLAGIGGIVAIHRTFDEDVLRAGLKNDTLALLLFPRDPIANAPATISALAAAFPAKAGSYLFGLLVRIGWFTPTLVTLDMALIMQFGARTRLLVLGRIAALLPTPENDLVRLVLDAMGVIDFDVGTASIDAMLVDSRLAHKFPITGSMAMRARWTSGPGRGFVMAVGGLNPHFAAPESLPALQRVGIALSSGDNPRLVCDAYMAITDNTVQYGSHVQLHAAAYGFSIDGDLGWDVLIQISPLHFLAEFHASVQLKHGSTNLFMVSVDGELEGPRPLRVTGKATFSIFWCDFTIRLDKTLVDGEPPPLPAAVDVLGALEQALADPANWRAVPADERTQGVALRRLDASPALVLDPLGQLQVRQQVVPLATARDIDVFGGAPVSGARRFELKALLAGAVQDATPLADGFAPAQFFAMSDDDKLAAPAIEAMTSGLAFGVAGAQFAAGDCVGAPLAYEQIVVDDLAAPPPPEPDRPLIGLAPANLLAWSATGAAARAPTRTSGRARFRAGEAAPAAALAPPAWRIVPLGDGAPAVFATPPRTYVEHLGALALLNRAAGAWQIVPEHELSA